MKALAGWAAALGSVLMIACGGAGSDGSPTGSPPVTTLPDGGTVTTCSGGSSSGGSAGTVGATGPQGPTGPQGAQGPQGPTGAPGAASTVPGPQGPEGPQGPQGPAGAASTVPGPAGPQGPQGPVGPAGAAGPSGSITSSMVYSVASPATVSMPAATGPDIQGAQTATCGTGDVMLSGTCSLDPNGQHGLSSGMSVVSTGSTPIVAGGLAAGETGPAPIGISCGFAANAGSVGTAGYFVQISAAVVCIHPSS